MAAEKMTADKRIEGTSQGRDHISEEQLLKVSKEVAIKFIEMGRITPATFESSFKAIHSTIRDSVKRG
jgi:5-formaminoimidazole-4-carboxamide-1-beta-D-ribofuranosyl 5'-monophosphate synthetase